MPVNVAATLRKVARQLEAEKVRINRQLTAIHAALQGVTRNTGQPATGGRGQPRRRMSAKARRAVAKRMKAYWAKRKARKSKTAKTS